ncbi:MAG: hypothetical protein AAGJ37_02430 [Pseudomonadota bacterium]
MVGHFFVPDKALIGQALLSVQRCDISRQMAMRFIWKHGFAKDNSLIPEWHGLSAPPVMTATPSPASTKLAITDVEFFQSFIIYISYILSMSPQNIK